MVPVIKDSCIRKESYKQYSGKVNLHAIGHLKKENYYLVDVPLDGDAPKQYIKAYFHYQNCPKKSKPSQWDGYYAKYGHKNYPHESIMEFGINMIGEALGLVINETKLICINNQVRFLSKDFIRRGSQKLIHGVEILHEYFEDKDFVDEINRDRKKRRELLTFDVIENAFNHVHPIQGADLLIDLVKLITYDAIVGNNDRHFYNWGVVGDIKNIENKKVAFAPIYDTARGLLWNKREQSVQQMYAQYVSGNTGQIGAFIKKSKPRFSFESNPSANHFDLVEFLSRRNPEYKRVIHRLCSKSMEESIYEKLNLTIFRYITPERAFLIEEILHLRLETIRQRIV